MPFGALGADCNLLPGLEILHGLLIDYLRPVGPVPDVALCGNGFTAPRSPHGPFLYADHRALAAQANALQHLFTVHGPRPGDKLTVPVDGPVTCTESPGSPSTKPPSRPRSPNSTLFSPSPPGRADTHHRAAAVQPVEQRPRPGRR